MSEPPFRQEALAHHRAQTGPGRVLRTAPRWTRVAFWLLALLAASGLVASALIEVDRVIFVPASIDGTRVAATLPAQYAEAIGRCPRARVIAGGESARMVELFATLDRVGGTAERPLRATGGTLELCIGRRPLIVDLVPGLGS